MHWAATGPAFGMALTPIPVRSMTPQPWLWGIASGTVPAVSRKPSGTSATRLPCKGKEARTGAGQREAGLMRLDERPWAPAKPMGSRARLHRAVAIGREDSGMCLKLRSLWPCNLRPCSELAALAAYWSSRQPRSKPRRQWCERTGSHRVRSVHPRKLHRPDTRGQPWRTSTVTKRNARASNVICFSRDSGRPNDFHFGPEALVHGLCRLRQE